MGRVKDAWLNGVAIKPGAEFTANARAGANTLVLQLNETSVAEGIKLSAGDVSFSSP